MNSAALRFLILVTVLFCPTQTFFLYTRSYFQLPWATSLRGHKARADDHNNRGINAKSSDNLRSELPRRLNSNDVAVPKLIADAFRVNQKKGWSTSDMEQLIAMREQDVGWDEIARNLFRSVNSCQVKYYNYLKTQSWNSAEHKRLLFFTVIHKEDWKTIGKELDRLPDVSYYGPIHIHILRNFP